MAEYAGKIDGKEVYEDFDIGDYSMILHGFEETTEFGDEPYYFHVTKAIIAFEVGGKYFYAECSDEFLSILNDFDQGYYKQIIKQIREG